jgi:hypothetical protein
MFDGSVMYGILFWFEMSSNAFSRGSMIGSPLVGYVERGTSPWRSRGFWSAKRKLTHIHSNVATCLRLNHRTQILDIRHALESELL